MNKKILIFAAVAFLIFTVSCGKTGPVGPDASGGRIMHFQNGVFPTAAYAGCADTKLWQTSFANTNFGADFDSAIGIQSSEKKRLLLRFDVSAIPSTVTVTSAVITIKTSELLGTETPVMAFHKMKKTWIEAEATWNKRNTSISWLTAGGEFDTSACSNSVSIPVAEGTYVWKIDKAVVQAWINNGTDNMGLLLKLNDETGYSMARFLLSGSGAGEDGPELTVIYTQL
jgi:hypothetical protein